MAWNCINWILHLSVDHNISLRNTSYRSCYNENFLCFLFFVVIVGFVCPLSYVCSFVCFGQFQTFWQRGEKRNWMSIIIGSCNCARTARRAFACIICLISHSNPVKFLLTLLTDEKIQTQRGQVMCPRSQSFYVVELVYEAWILIHG